MGVLKFTYGVMGCGKSAYLIDRAVQDIKDGYNTVVIAISTDERGNGYITSRNGKKIKADIVVNCNTNLFDIIPSYVEKLYVDEVQFLLPEQIDQLAKLSETNNINVYCFGLTTDFRMEYFSTSKKLWDLTYPKGLTEEIPMNCTCGNKATNNARFNNGILVTEGEQIAVDGLANITYESICKECFDNLAKNKGPIKIRKKG